MPIDGSAKDKGSQGFLEDEIERLKTRRLNIDYQIEELRVEKNEIDTQLKRLEKRLSDLRVPSDKNFVQEGADETLPQFTPILKEIPESEIVTKESLPEAKFELFHSLFSGRPDMHAKRFQSQSSGVSGYSVVCANEFKRDVCTKGDKRRKRIKCIDCDHQDFGEITFLEFKSHIEGKSDLCNDVLGAYAIDQDAMCSFIVADFDREEGREAKEAFEDLCESVVTFLQVSEKFCVPTYLERSRSGEGFHVWLFFETPVSAKDARRLYSALLTIAMEENIKINFDSYDRFIPHQDTIPATGFGNLVALPLQGAAGRRGHSVFLNGRLEVYADQWKFLSRVKRLSQDELRNVLARVPSKDDLGKLMNVDIEDSLAKPWEKKRSELPLSQQDFMGTLKIVEANMLHLEKNQLSTRAYNRIRRLAAFRNPEFYEAQKMHRDTWLYPRVLFMADETGAYLSLPRGIKDALFNILQEGDISYKLTDKTQKGKRIRVSFKGELRREQLPAVKALLSYNIGVLEATTGFGKTVVGIKLIAEKGLNTLILVNNKNLLAQWKEALQDFLEIFDEPPVYFTPTGRERRCPTVGEYSGAKKRLSGLVDIAMMQSLFRKGETSDIVKDYGMIIVDECHHVPSFTFESVLKAANAKYVYGLTATPDRKDGHENILYAQCGPVRYKVNPLDQAKKRSFEQVVIPRFTNSLPEDPSEKFNIAKLYGELANDHRRNELIVSDVLVCIEAKRNPLVLTERTEHVAELAKLLKNYSPNVLAITGRMSNSEKKTFRNRIRSIGKNEQVIIVATGKYIGEGFDFDRLDTLFLTLPISWKGTVAQYTGRLHRTHEGKSRVEVYDYVDIRIPQFERMYRKRLKGYKAVGYKVAPKGVDVNSEDIIYGADNYRDALVQDFERARKEVVLCSPYLMYRKVESLMPVLIALQKEGVKVGVLAAELKRPSDAMSQQRSKIAKLLEANDIALNQEPGFNYQCAIIDRRVVWYGSINFLGKNSSDDGTIRIIDPEVADALLEQFR